MFPANAAEGISPVVLYAALGTCGTFIILLIVLAVILLRCKSSGNVLVVENPRSDRKNYHKSDLAGAAVREKLNPPPPDLWIGHDQLELKGIDGDETVDTTLARSTSPDYRSASSMDRTRNYGVLAYSGEQKFQRFCLLFADSVIFCSKFL